MFVTDVVLYTKYSEGVTRGHRIWLRMSFSISSGLGQFVADSVDHSEGVLRVAGLLLRMSYSITMSRRMSWSSTVKGS